MAKKTTVKKADLVNLYVALGLKAAGGWSDTKLIDKLGELEDLNDGKVKLTPEQTKLFKTLVKAAENEDNIVIESGPAPKAAAAPAKGGKPSKAAAKDEDDEDEDEEDDEEESEDEDEEDDEESEDDDDEEEVVVKKKPPIKAKKDEKPAKKADKKPSKPRGEPAEVDRFGMREGTRAARINKAITGKPKTVAQIMADADYDKSIHGHMQKLRSLNHVKYDPENKTYWDPKLAKAKEAVAVKGGKPAKKK